MSQQRHLWYVYQGFYTQTPKHNLRQKASVFPSKQLQASKAGLVLHFFPTLACKCQTRLDFNRNHNITVLCMKIKCASSCSTMVEHLPHHPKVQGSNPAANTSTQRKKMVNSKKGITTHCRGEIISKISKHRDHIHNTPFSSQLTNWPNKLECYITQDWKGLPMTNTLTHWSNF